MKTFSFILCIFMNCFLCEAQQKVLPEELKSFVLPGYEMLDYAEGKLDSDQQADAILILKLNQEDTVTTDDPIRPFLLLTRQQDGKLKLAKRNDSLVMCRRCGGVFGDPYENIEIKNNGFTISFYGGSSWRWGYNYSFSYDKIKTNWFLVREEQMHYHNTEPDINVKEAVIEADELGVVPIEKFNSDPGYSGSEWKVITAKAYFYDSPKLGSKPRKGYILKGDIATVSRVLKNFVEVSFENKKEVFTSGYILKTSLQKVK